MERSFRLSREIWGVVIGVLAIFLVLSILSYEPRDRSFSTPSGTPATGNWGGVVGAYLADILLQGLGLSAYLFPLILLVASIHLFREVPRGPSLR
ncbi:MAG: DNA translocase FtsK 4TM domain-containing protein, partial [Candidatus Binatia bacterium]|nr:DNA translocase FtsK 4TM domain-containing protein [Candidatus Binatia bacterium]